MVALSLGLSNFAAAVGIGVSGIDGRTRLRVGVIFGLFETAMPILGLLLGRSLATEVGHAARWIGAALLIATGLYAAIQAILRAAVDSGGTSFAGYVNQARGRPGYLGQAHVFRRQGLPCDVCGTPIIRTTVAGRATNFCPRCQQR